MTKNQHTTMQVLIGTFIVLIVFLFAVGSLPESTFQLANESRLPQWIGLPASLDRKAVSLEMSYYNRLWGNDVGFTLKDLNGRTLEQWSGKLKCNEPIELKSPPPGVTHIYPSYEVITVNGVSEIIEHKKPEPIFYITDDPVVLKEISVVGCG